MMNILVNEKPATVTAGSTLYQVRDRFQPEADLVIHNGFPVSEDCPLSEGDRVVLINKGVMPSGDELEALMTSRHTPGVHERVKKAKVGIAGAGGLGSSIAVALARIGVGKLIVADFDLVEPSNLNRQQYFVDQIGIPKVEALKENLARINPYIDIVTHTIRLTAENIPRIFEEVDILVEAFDAPDQKAMLVESFLSRVQGKPLVAASGMAGFCSSNSITTRRAANNFYLVGDGETAARPGEGLMSPRVGIAAHHQANAVLRLIMGEEPE